MSMKFFLFINVEMLTIVGILLFISQINTTYLFKSKKNLNFQHFNNVCLFVLLLYIPSQQLWS